jgi:plastocyanin
MTPDDTPTSDATVVTIVESEFDIALDTPVTSAGAYSFVVENHGGATHNLVIEGPGLPGTMTSAISAGGESVLDVTLEPGTYTLYCSIPGHRSSGMETTLTVS